MIQFVTLFLGLVTGPQAVQAVVPSDVVAVEFHLDGAVVGRIEQPPWKLSIEFGDEIVPRLLEAVAFDAEHLEVGRVSQTINRPRPPVEVRLALEADSRGRAVAARVTWESTLNQLPLAARASFDGESVAVLDPERVPLPPHDKDVFHFVQVELEFAGGATAGAQLGFGGSHLDQVHTELTALPVVLRAKGREPKMKNLAGWFTRDEAALEVVAFEKGPLEIVVVRGLGVPELIRNLPTGSVQGLGSGTITSGTEMGDLRGVGATASSDERLRLALSFEGENKLRMLLPIARTTKHRYLAMDLFAASPEITEEQGGLYWALTQRIELPGAQPEQRLADAVAVAGLRAASGNRRRAVVLILGDDSSDKSRYKPKSVMNFLRTMSVPLYVWQVGEPENSVPGWPEPGEVGSFKDLRNAIRIVEKDLSRQRIAWVRGSHTPESIQLSSGAQVSRVSVP